MLRLLLTGSLLLSVISLTTAQRTRPELVRLEATPVSATVTPGYYLIKGDPPSAYQRVQSVTRDHHIVYLEDSLPANSLLYRINNQWKLAPGLPESPPYIVTVRTPEAVEVVVRTFSGQPVPGSLSVLIPAARLPVLMDHPGIVYISPAKKAVEESLVPFVNQGLNRIKAFHEAFPEVRGENSILSVKEQGYNPEDPDLRGRSAYEEPGLSISIHATEMATLAAGSGLLAAETEGVSPAVLLKQASFSSLFAETDSYYEDVTVQNHSYGTSPEPFYGPEAASYDQSAEANPSLTHVFSIGNAGTQTPGAGPYTGITGFSTLTGNFKNAKNILTVSSSDATGQVIPQNSRGPTFDGRIRPEIVAYGEGGTSDAAALVSGSAAVLSELYSSQTGETAEFALIRAILLAGSDEVGTPGPDYSSGYGQLNLIHSARIIEQANYQQLSGTSQVSLVIPEGTASVRLVLSWFDPPATPGDQVLLVRDADMALQGPSGPPVLPWTLSAYPHADSLALPARRGPDHRNTQELITLENPEPGTYQVLVEAGEDFPMYLAWHTEQTGYFSWRYPLENTVLTAGQPAPVYWDTSLSGDAQIAWRTQNGEWQEVGMVNAGQESFTFDAPDTTAVVQLRLQSGGQTYESAFFTFSEIPNTSVDYVCENDWQISWSPVPNATSYQIRGRKNNKLISLISKTDTILNSSEVNYTDSLISVQAYLANYPAGRAVTFHIGRQGVGCYFAGFTGLVRDTDIQLTVRLGTSDGISRMVVERVNDGLIIGESTNPATEIILTDSNPQTGPNRYQAALYLDDGRVIRSDILSFIYVPAGAALIYPNPVQSGEILRVISEDPDTMLEIITMQGSVLTRIPLITAEEDIPMTIAAGIYLYRVRTNSAIIQAGRLVVY